MEKRGLIERTPDQSDGRSVKLSVTEKGLEKHRRFEQALATFLPSLLDKGNSEAMLDAFCELAYILDQHRASTSADLVEALVEDIGRP